MGMIVREGDAGEDQSSPAKAIWIAIAFLLVVTYFGLVIFLAPGAPFMDDLNIANSVNRGRVAANPLTELWAQHNEHRPLITKLIFGAQQSVTGSFSYTALAFIGNLFLLPVFAILVSYARNGAKEARMAAIVFAAALTFSYTSADSMLWAMAALSNYGVVAFALLTFWLLSKRSTLWSIGALVSALLAALSQGNGLLVLLLGCLFLLLDRRWMAAILWVAASAAFIFVYLSGYIPSAENANPWESIARPAEVALFALVFSGSALGYPTESETLRVGMIIVSATLGLILWAHVVWRFIIARFRSVDPLLWFSVFVMASGVLAALNRLDTGIIQALTPRYHINSCMLIVAGVLMLAAGPDGSKPSAIVRRAMPAFAVLAIAYVAVSTLTLWRMHTFYLEQTRVTATQSVP
jgi:hypothetical protein